MLFPSLVTVVCISELLVAISGEIKVLQTTATTIEWDLTGSLHSGKKHSVEVLLDSGSAKVRVIDEPLNAKETKYKAFNLKSNQVYQLRLHVLGVKSEGELSRPTFTNIRCYSCKGVKSVEYCDKLIECSPNQRQCYTQVRWSNSGNRFYIYKGCKVSRDVCIPNKERLAIAKEANSVTGDLTKEQIINTMPGLKYFGDLDELFAKSPAILKRVKKKFDQRKKNLLLDALKANCSKKKDETDFCRCCCNAERCNHGMLDCGVTPTPDVREEEPLPPDIATPPPEVTFPTPPPRKVAPICRDFNGGCDHICVPLNKTTVRCECNEDYKLQEDGKTCKTHLLHAVADAGPDITITLPQNSVTISGNGTMGAPKMFNWWSPIAFGEGASLTIMDSADRDLQVANLKVGTYRFILTVTGMDGRRTTDMMTLTVQPHPSTVNTTQKLTTKQVKPKPILISQSRYTSVKQRNVWKAYMVAKDITTPAPKPTQPRLLFRSSATTPKAVVIRRPGGRRTPASVNTPKPTAATRNTPTSKLNKEKTTPPRKGAKHGKGANKKPKKPTGKKGRRKPTG